MNLNGKKKIHHCTWLGHWSDDCFAQSNNPIPTMTHPSLVKNTKQTLVNKNNVQINAFQNTEVALADWSRTMAICFADMCNQTYAASHKANVRNQLHAHFLVAQIWRGTPPNITDLGLFALPNHFCLPCMVSSSMPSDNFCFL